MTSHTRLTECDNCGEQRANVTDEYCTECRAENIRYAHMHMPEAFEQEDGTCSVCAATEFHMVGE